MSVSAIASDTELGELPRWDLSDLYPGTDSEALQQDLAAAAAEAAAFRADYLGKIADLTGSELALVLARYEKLQEILGRIGSYAGLLYAGDMSDPRIAQFSQTMQERGNAIGSELLFLSLEINRIEDDALAQKLAEPPLQRYSAWLRDCRSFRPYQLSDDLEKLLYEKYVSGRGAWSRLFDETIAGLKFPIGGRDLGSAEALNLLSDRDPARRAEAAACLGTVLGSQIRTFALITNTLAKDKEIEDRWRRFPRPISSRNLGNCVEDEVVDALITATKRAFPDLSHRYYRMKAKWLGVEKLNHWDRNAPLPEDDDRLIPWAEAREIVLTAYGAFSPELARIGEQFFDRPWIDAPTRPGKSPGAFAHSTVPSVHPYLLLNYLGRTRDVMTLAHELGHGVHQVLSARQGYLQADTPLTLAETASVFGEMLTFRQLLKQAAPKRRRIMLASKVEDMINTVVRQIAFAEFERLVHDERRQGELLPERIGEIWMQVQRESLGDAFDFSPDYAVYWTYIGHFIHTPFYVYAYAFGDCLVNSLYATYQNAHEGFAERYLAMLSAGGTLRHKELLQPFGLDASDPAFWDRGLSVIKGFIDELEAME